jgi:hypothetical protein
MLKLRIDLNRNSWLETWLKNWIPDWSGILRFHGMLDVTVDGIHADHTFTLNVSRVDSSDVTGPVPLSSQIGLPPGQVLLMVVPLPLPVHGQID